MEEENRYQEALETAKEIDVVENVMIRTVTTQMAFSSMMGGLERGDYVIPDFRECIAGVRARQKNSRFLW